MLTEAETRFVAYEPVEVSWANNRPHNERPPTPEVGAQVLYRRDPYDQDPVSVRVVRVQPVDDLTHVHSYPGFGPARDPNLWTLVRDTAGRPIIDPTGPRYAPHPDPWPSIRVAGLWPPWPGAREEQREALCRESRLRGSPGWLPLDWRSRPVRLPHQYATLTRPDLRPLNVPYDQVFR